MSQQDQEGNSQSSERQQKSRKIRKSPKPTQPHFQNSLPHLRLQPQFGVFQNETQKIMRLDKFWRQEIEQYYRPQLQQSQKDFLIQILKQRVPSLRQILRKSSKQITTKKVPYQQLFRYVQILKQSYQQSKMFLVRLQNIQYLVCITANNESYKLIQITNEQAQLVSFRQKCIKNIMQRQSQYNSIHQSNMWLSQIHREVSVMLHLMNINKKALDQSLVKILQKANSEPTPEPILTKQVQDNYITFLIKKNIAKALENKQIDFFNYYATLDSLEQYGSIDPQQRPITSARQFEEYIKKKKNKKAKKNPKGVLKTACAGCLSPYYEQYNPITHCPQCHIRFHKFCYTASIDGFCESCAARKNMGVKSKQVDCLMCPNKGLLSACEITSQNNSIHIFCMLVHNLWKVQDGLLLLTTDKLPVSQNICVICKTGNALFDCRQCKQLVHPLCSYLYGWEMGVEDSKIWMKCCGEGDKEQLSYKRKYILNYKKILLKTDR